MSHTIGVRAHDYGRNTPQALCSAIAGDGWQTVQLAFPKAIEGVKTFDDVTPALVDETARALKASGLTVAVLGAYIEPSLMDEAARRAQVGVFLGALTQAAALNAVCVGTETTNMAKQPGVTRTEALRQLRRSLDEILPTAEALGVTVAVEPVHYHALHTPEATRQLLDELRSSNLKLIFDPVNLLRQEDIPVQRDLWARCADCFGRDIAALHLKGASAVAKPDGVLENAPFETSAVDYAALSACLRGIDAPILRELAVPANAAADLAFLRQYFP